ncbi:MAG: 2-phosphosulfolactate phosphatase family protein [Synechococcales cyanobacterium RM1_1_8]|nr:2-phosphosulfolactate phosphatase family protein [Synechococcales cyanobacterium RM1_1_8]
MKFSIFHTPEQTPTMGMPDCAIAIDVLRATTTIATALHAGAEGIQTFSDLEVLIATSEAWPVEKRLRAGERGGQQIEGYDLGNSPLLCTPERVGGKRIFLSTTNGTRALETVRPAPLVLTAALINRASVVQYLLKHQPETVWMVSSGWEGSYSLEDTVCAGAVLHGVMAATGQPLLELMGNDEAFAAVALFDHWQSRLLELMHHASHGQRLLKLQGDEDIAYCAQLDLLGGGAAANEPRFDSAGDVGLGSFQQP